MECNLITLLWFCIITIVAFENSNFITSDEKFAIKKFREMVKEIVHENYQLEDYYLLRFLRAKELNLERTMEMFGKAMEWRKVNKIDEILKDTEFSKWTTNRFPVTMDEKDRTGSPVLIVSVGLWDVRKITLAGKLDHLVRYVDYLYESVNGMIREYRNSTGNDITQYFQILDMANYNVKQHACLACIPFFKDMVKHYEKYYPTMAKFFVFINTPTFFQELLQILRPFMSKDTKTKLIIYRYDKSEWSQFLLRHIPPENLLPQYGGVKRKKDPKKELP